MKALNSINISRQFIVICLQEFDNILVKPQIFVIIIIESMVGALHLTFNSSKQSNNLYFQKEATFEGATIAINF